MERSKNNFVYFVSIFFLILVFSLKTFAQDKQVLFEAKINKDRISKGEAIQLDLIFKNTTNALITIFDANAERSADINIKNNKGEILSLTKEGRKKKFPDIIIHREGIYLEPGKELNWKINLNEFFDTNQLGDYEANVKITYNAENPLKKGEFEVNTTISSNKVKFKVIK